MDAKAKCHLRETYRELMDFLTLLFSVIVIGLVLVASSGCGLLLAAGAGAGAGYVAGHEAGENEVEDHTHDHDHD